MVGVAGVVAEWLSLDERLIFQQVSQIISCQLKMQLGRGAWDTLEADGWTFAQQRMGTALPRDARKRVRLP